MQRYNDNILARSGGFVIPAAGASATVKSYPAGTVATIYSDDGVTPKTNPIVTGSEGEFFFYAADGRYSLEISGGGYTGGNVVDITLDGLGDTDVDTLRTDLLAAGGVLLVGNAADKRDLASAANGKGAALVGFIQDGAGAEDQTADEKLKESVSASDYMTPADRTANYLAPGSVDVSYAIQAALNAAHKVTLPDRIYLANNLLLPATGIELAGENPFTTVLKNTHATNHTLRTDSATARNLWVFIHGITFGMATNGQSGDAIHLSNPEHALIEKCNITTPPGLATTGNGIYTERSAIGSAGYYVTIRKTLVEKQGRGVYFKGGSGYRMNVGTLDDVVINNNTAEGLLLEETTKVRLINSSLEQNSHNVRIINSRGATVENCYMERPDTHNVVLDTGTEAALITKNLLSSAGNVDTATGRGVLVMSGAQANQLLDNTYIDGWSTYDIEVAAGALQTDIKEHQSRDRVAGWGASRPAILDNGTQTALDRTYLTAGGSFIREISGQIIRLLSATLSAPIIARTNGSATEPSLYSGDANPTAGGGIAGPAGSLYQRVLSRIALYHKRSATDTDWGEVPSFLPGSATYDPPSIAAGGVTTTTIAVTNAALGDFVECSFSIVLVGVIVTGWVSSAGTVTIQFYNPTAGAIDLGSGTLRVRVFKG